MIFPLFSNTVAPHSFLAGREGRTQPAGAPPATRWERDCAAEASRSNETKRLAPRDEYDAMEQSHALRLVPRTQRSV